MMANDSLDHEGTIEFGVCLGKGNDLGPYRVPAGREAHTALQEMANATRGAMLALSDQPARYDPAEKHASQEYLFMDLSDPLCATLRELHEVENLRESHAALDDPERINAYFARFTGGGQGRLTAIRRASYFKGLRKHPILQVIDDQLELVEPKIFKLDRNFDMLIHGNRIEILRPSAFETLADLREAILQSVPNNVEAIQERLPFVDFSAVGEFASTRSRIANQLASLRADKMLKDISRASLESLCQRTGVEIAIIDGKLSPSADQVGEFLEVLDRRRYEIELIPGTPERFRADSRRKLDT